MKKRPAIILLYLRLLADAVAISLVTAVVFAQLLGSCTRTSLASFSFSGLHPYC